MSASKTVLGKEAAPVQDMSDVEYAESLIRMLRQCETAEFLGVKSQTVKKLQDTGALPYFIVCGNRRTAMRDLVAYLKAQRIERKPAA